MGGNALKHTTTRRYAKAEYEALRDEVLAQLRTDFPRQQAAAIPAYRAKESFGDLDVLFTTDGIHDDLAEYVKATFKAQEVVRNSHVISFDVREFQVDLIGSTTEDFAMSLHYFAWNDLGNILGRLYHKMGFKYGHTGLSMIFKDGDYQYAELKLSNEIEPILAFAGLDSARFLAGFDTLENIFQFAASSPYFNKAIYLLENRNHASRTRDRKRQTYNALLQWLVQQPHLTAYPWDSVREQGGRQYQQVFMERAFAFFPDFQPRFMAVQARFVAWQQGRAKFNGLQVQAWTGLEKQALGEFMRYLKAQSALAFADTDAWQAWLAQVPLTTLEHWVKQYLQQYLQAQNRD